MLLFLFFPLVGLGIDFTTGNMFTTNGRTFCQSTRVAFSGRGFQGCCEAPERAEEKALSGFGPGARARSSLWFCGGLNGS